jgi:hypothetical protein
MTPLLLTHILGGILAGLVVFRSVYVLVKNQKETYKNLIRALSFLAAFEVLSGILLAYTSPSITAQSLCTNIFLYLSIIALTYMGFVYRMKPSWQNIALTVSPTVGSLGILTLALIKGV